MTELKKELKTITLSDGSIATFGDFKGKHLLQAQKLVGEDKDRIVFGMIASCVTIDGKKVLIEDVDEMPGSDVLKLIGELSENF